MLREIQAHQSVVTLNIKAKISKFRPNIQISQTGNWLSMKFIQMLYGGRWSFCRDIYSEIGRMKSKILFDVMSDGHVSMLYWWSRD